MNKENRQQEMLLNVLQSIEGEPNISQRSLAQRLGVALGVANACLKRCVHKGLVKIEQTPANRYLYFITPQGFVEKASLTAQYVKRSLSFYRDASASFSRCFQQCQQQQQVQIVLCGISDLTEIALLWAQQAGLEVLAIYDASAQTNEHLNLPVWQTLPTSTDAVFVLSTATAADKVYQQLLAQLDQEKILVPDIITLKR